MYYREIVCITDNFKNLHGTKKFDGFSLPESLISIDPLFGVLIPIGPMQLSENRQCHSDVSSQ
jgi:hypothetical protein